MQKEYKKKRLIKIRPIIEKEIDIDITSYGVPRSRPLVRWMQLINESLKCTQDRISNGSEMASLFKKLKEFFVIERKSHYIPIGDTFEESAKKSRMYYLVSYKEKSRNFKTKEVGQDDKYKQ